MDDQARKDGTATLDDLRRARGEGWEWPRIQTDPCPQCGDHPGALDPARLGDLARERAAGWREFLDTTDEAYLRVIPGPAIFSPLQYGAHVRDILRVYRERMELGLREDSPSFPTFNPPDEAWAAYNRMDPAELAADIEAQADRLAAVVSGIGPEQWSRTVVSNRGGDGVYSFTIAGLACNAVHEAHHHLLDATGALPHGSQS